MPLAMPFAASAETAALQVSRAAAGWTNDIVTAMTAAETHINAFM